jgi:hypothetical protein
MKAIILLAVLGGSAFLTGCHEVVVDRHRHRGPSAVVVRDRGYHRGPTYYNRGSSYRRGGYYAPGYRSGYRRSGRVIVY